MVRLVHHVLPLGLAVAVVTLACACDVGSDGAKQNTTSQADVPPALPDADGDVLSLASFGARLYVGGEFGKLGEYFGQFAVDGRQDIPRVLGGDVWTVEPDGAGGWFVGGDFDSVGGEECPRLAHVSPDGTLDRRWCVAPDSTVYELTLEGANLYVGGRFGHIAGKRRSAIAAFDVAAASLLEWGRRFHAVGCESADEFEVSQIEVARQSVFVGGCFIEVAGKLRDGIAALDRTTGRLTAWQPRLATGPLYAPSGEKDVPPSLGAWGLAPARDALFVVTARGTAKLDAATGRVTRMFPAASGHVSVLAVSGSTMYMGGDFDRIDGLPRRNLAAVDVSSGVVTAWRPDADVSIDVVVPAGRTVYVAGNTLERVGGARREGVAAVDSQSGRATRWEADVTGSWVWDVGVSEPGRLGIGFAEGGVRGVARDGLAAIDTRTGALTRWAPAVEGQAKALTVSGTTLYVGGSFSRINGMPRDGMAAIDARTGQVLPWSPKIDGGWDWIEARDGVVYAARRFDGAGSSNGGLIALDERDGRVLWTARLGDPGYLAAALMGETLFATQEADYSEFLGAFESTSGRHVELDYPTPQSVSGLAQQDRLYVSTLRPAFFAFDPESGAEQWRTPVDGAAQTMTTYGDVLYIGGFFEQVSGRPRKSLAAVRADTGELKDWAPTIPGTIDDIHALHVVGSAVYVGGGFEGRLVAFPLAD